MKKISKNARETRSGLIYATPPPSKSCGVHLPQHAVTKAPLKRKPAATREKPKKPKPVKKSAKKALEEASSGIVKQLKEELDGKACAVESLREELDRANGRIAALQRDVDQLEDALLCPICMDHRRATAFSKCGHSTCEGCSATLKQCPVCRTTIGKRLKLWW